MQIGDELTVKIEKMSNLGLGIAKSDGFVIFVEAGCPGDLLKIKIVKKNKNYANAVISEIVEPSLYRVSPECSMQKICGACQLQFIDYNYQLVLKKEIVSDLMRGLSVKINDVIPSPDIFEYRRKIQYPVSETKNSKRIIAGYYKQGSHDIVNIKHCPIQPSECSRIIDFIRDNAPLCGVSGYYEKKHQGLLRHVLIRSSKYNNKNLVTFVINDNKITDKIKKLAHILYEKFDSVIGVCVNFNTDKTNLILGKNTEIMEGTGFTEEKLCGIIFKIAPETFFQVNPSTANNIFEFIKEHIKMYFSSPDILDAYAGISAFGICLSDIAQNIVCVEENSTSVNMARQVINDYGIRNVELNCNDAGAFFESLVMKGKLFDVIILDPPRKGCSKESLDYAMKLVKGKIIYVSCDPSTLARDLKYLESFGFKTELIQPFDMFPQTYHIENVAIISKC